MNCIDCEHQMIWQNDWTIDEGEDELTQTDYICPNEKCGLHISIYRRVDSVDNIGDNLKK